jgi:NTP pyrophosphatase (non-canonical NTP hydrolase)
MNPIVPPESAPLVDPRALLNHYEFNSYQRWTRTTAVYNKSNSGRNSQPISPLVYCVLGLNGESGEVAEVVKKFHRDHEPVTDMPDEVRMKLIKELGDVLWYLARTADEIGIDLSEIAASNVEKLEDRRQHGKIHGSGDNR